MSTLVTSRFAVVLCMLAVAACSQPAAETTTSLVTGPIIVEMNPSGIAPLTGLVQFTTDQPVRVSLTIRDGEHEDMSVTPVDAFNTEHELMLLGLRPNRSHQIEISIEDTGGSTSTVASVEVTTEALPHWLPSIETRVSQPERMEPGVTLLPVFNDNDPTQSFVVGLDDAGDVIWFLYYSMDEPRRLQNGNLLAHTDQRTALKEFDMLGRVVRHWHATGVNSNVPPGAIPVAADSFHHDVLEMPSGNFLAISSEIRHLETYRADDLAGNEVGPMAVDVVSDRFIEFRPDDGSILRDWKLTDLLDTNRISHGPFEFATDHYELVYESVFDELPLDWTHSNGIFYEEATDSVIVSIRKMSAVVKINLAESRLEWILGNPNGWGPEFTDLLLEPVGDVSWIFGQHAPEITPDGTLLIYDNGSFGRAYPTQPPQPMAERYSRAVEFDIDEEAGTVQQVWSYGGPGSEHFYAEFVSEADRLPITGNTLLTNGGQMVTKDGEQTNDFEAGRVWLSVKEVTTTMPADKVWEIVIDDPMNEWGSYRAERLPSLYLHAIGSQPAP